jgi:hypothetical protein
MIVFDLSCSKGHVFEGWFESLDAFEEQGEKGLVTCPYCEDQEIRRVMSPVAVKRSVPTQPGAPDQIDYQKLAKEIVNYFNENFENVGPRFAAEALKMHYGVSEKRNIRGSATEEEEKTLKEEKIAFFKVPVPRIKDEEENQ